MEKQLKREEIYNGHVISVVKDEVELDDGSTSNREIVLHNGGACIALRDGVYFYMVKQYRYAFDRKLYEFPAGKIEKGEDHLSTVLREAIEETGYSVKNLLYFGYIIPTCGYCAEKIYLYYGEADEYLGQHFDKDEDLELEKFTFKQIREMVKEGMIEDSKTVALMYHLELAGINE